MYEKILSDAGLSRDQAVVYELLIGHGGLPAREISKRVGITRPLTYKVLEELVGMGLATKKKGKNNVLIFSPQHPSHLETIAEENIRNAEVTKDKLGSILAKLISDFNLVSGKPGIKFFEGVEGIKEIYDDILRTGEDFYLVRAIHEPTNAKQMLPIIESFVRKRVKAGIKVTAVTPLDKFAKERYSPEKDKKVLMKRVMVDPELYSAPVEIDIYGDKVAILSFSKELIGVIIESPQIAQSFKQLFVLAAKGIG